jgi:hypothetical protein
MDAASKELERYRQELKTYLTFMLAQTNDDLYILSLIKGDSLTTVEQAMRDVIESHYR